MVTKKSALKPSQLLQTFKPEVLRIAEDYHRGVAERGFLHWSISQILIDQDLTDEDIAGQVIIDGPGDLGIDAFWIDDETNKVFHIFQSKYRSEPGKPIDEKDLDTFLQSPQRALDPFLVADSPNNGIKELHEQLVRLIPQGYVLHLAFITDGLPSGRVRELKQKQEIRVQTLTVGTKQLVLSHLNF